MRHRYVTIHGDWPARDTAVRQQVASGTPSECDVPVVDDQELEQGH